MRCCCSPTCARKRASSSLRSPMQRPTGRSGRRWRASRTRSPTPRSMATRSICWPTEAIRAAEVVPEASMVIHGIGRARDGLYLHMIDGGLGKLRRLTRDAQVVDITLPFDGTLAALAVTASEDGALFSFTGWLTAADIWSVDARGRVTPTGLTPK